MLFRSNSGRASSKRNVEETAFRTNIEAAEEIARQLRLRDLGGLIVIDFIDMRDRKHEAEVEKTFKKALSLDRARIQLSRISRFGILELSRQKKQSTIQEISYTNCPFCKGSGVRPSLEYTAISAFRKIESQAVKGVASSLKVTLPYEVADYLLNQKRSEISKLETLYNMSLHISGSSDMAWDGMDIKETARDVTPETPAEEKYQEKTTDKPEEGDIEAVTDTLPQVVGADEQAQKDVALPEKTIESPRKRSHRRPRYRRKKSGQKAIESKTEMPPQETDETVAQKEEKERGILPLVVPEGVKEGELPV